MDLGSGIKLWPVWGRLAIREIQLSVHRTVLGPFWLVLQRIFVGVAFSFLGLVLWGNSGGLNVEVLVAYMVYAIMIGYLQTANTALISTINLADSGLPISIRLLKPWAREFLLSLISSIVILLVVGFSGKFSYEALLVVIILITCMGMWGLGIIMLVSPLALRFRDFSQIVLLISIVLMFFSPIFWNISDAKNKELAYNIVTFNPIADSILAFRSLIGTGSVSMNYVMHLLIQTIVVIGFGFLCFSISRRRIPYWN